MQTMYLMQFCCNVTISNFISGSAFRSSHASLEELGSNSADFTVVVVVVVVDGG
jgi:hypothetical protein